MHIRFVDPVSNHVNTKNDLVKYPVKELVKDPVKDSVNDPVNEPVKDPVNEPVKDPVKDPVNDPVKDSVNDPVNDPVNDSVNDPVKRNILKYLEQNFKANYGELANKTGYSASTIKRHIQELKRIGIIERIGSDKTGCWKINLK
jgi:hypothetical protein